MRGQIRISEIRNSGIEDRGIGNQIADSAVGLPGPNHGQEKGKFRGIASTPRSERRLLVVPVSELGRLFQDARNLTRIHY